MFKARSFREPLLLGQALRESSKPTNRWAGEPFDVHACVQALFTIKLPKQAADPDQQAA